MNKILGPGTLKRINWFRLLELMNLGKQQYYKQYLHLIMQMIKNMKEDI